MRSPVVITPTRWSTTFPPQDNVHHAIYCRAVSIDKIASTAPGFLRGRNPRTPLSGTAPFLARFNPSRLFFTRGTPGRVATTGAGGEGFSPALGHSLMCVRHYLTWVGYSLMCVGHSLTWVGHPLMRDGHTPTCVGHYWAAARCTVMFIIHCPLSGQRERIFIECMRSDRKLKGSR